MRRAVVIGAATFSDSNFTPLNYAVADAQRFGEVLGAPDYGFFDDIQFLPNPTLPAARRSLEKLARHAAADDLILFYYSGHGRLDHDGSLLLILPETDIELPGTSAINGNELKQLFNSSRAAQKIVILDCCYSGAIGPQEFFKGGAEDTVASLAHQTTGAFILTASTRFQPAFESTALGGGTLTSCLIQGIETGDAAPQGSRHVTLGNLAAYARDNVPRHGAQQPQYWDLGSTGDVIMAYRKRLADLAWRKRVDAMLSRHFAKDSLDGDIIDDARRHLSRGGFIELDEHLSLLDRLLDRKIGVGPFVRRWLALAADESSPPPKSAPPREDPPTEPEPPKAQEPPPPEPEKPAKAAETPPAETTPSPEKAETTAKTSPSAPQGTNASAAKTSQVPPSTPASGSETKAVNGPANRETLFPPSPKTQGAQPGSSRWFITVLILTVVAAIGFVALKAIMDGGAYDYPAPAETTELAAQNDPAMAIEAARGFVGDWAPKGLTCEDKFSITLENGVLNITSGTENTPAKIVEQTADGAVSTTVDGGSMTFKLSDTLLHITRPDGSTHEATRCAA